MARKSSVNDQRLTIYLPDGAVGGRVVQFTQTGLTAYVDSQVPRSEWLRFTLHLQGRVIGGEMMALAQDERICRLQFASLRPGDRQFLEPLMESDEN